MPSAITVRFIFRASAISADVITASGQFKERVRIICPGDPTRDRLIFSGGRFYRIAGYWDAVFKVQSETPDPNVEQMSVTCYRIR